MSKKELSSVNEKVYQQLRHEIMAGLFERGSKLSIRSLAARYNTSFTPVREAIKRLVAEGGLEVQANRTFRIPKLSPARRLEILEVRCLLEGQAAEQATPHMNATTLRKLEAIERKRRKQTEKGDADGVRESNRQFHFAIYRRAKNSTLMQLIESLWLRYASSYSLTMHQDGSPTDFPDHDKILAALKTGNPTAARRAVVKDLVNTVDKKIKTRTR